MREIFKGRSGSFIACGDPLVLYTGGASHKITAAHERLQGVNNTNPRAVSVTLSDAKHNLTGLIPPLQHQHHRNNIAILQ